MSTQRRIQIKRLKGKTEVDLLFNKGNVVQTKTLLLKYLHNTEKDCYFSGVSVPKKSFQKELPPESLFSGSGMLLFRGSKPPSLDLLIKDVESLFQSIDNN